MLSNSEYNIQFDEIFSQALDLVNSSLNQPDIPYNERLNAALKILEIGILSSQQKQLNSLLPDVIPSTDFSPDSFLQNQETEAIILNPDYVQLDNFLSEEDYQKLLKMTLANQDKFFPSEVINHESKYRESYILLPQHFVEFHELLTHQLLSARPNVIQQLKIPMFLVSHLEMQITAHLHGGYYKIHQDVDAGKAGNRRLTYVYYFYQEPKPFYGGDLRLYETKIQGNHGIIQERFISIEPRNNSIIFFDSRCKHEVLPVYCPSQKSADSRFALNGWIHG